MAATGTSQISTVPPSILHYVCMKHKQQQNVNVTAKKARAACSALARTAQLNRATESRFHVTIAFVLLGRTKTGAINQQE